MLQHLTLDEGSSTNSDKKVITAEMKKKAGGGGDGTDHYKKGLWTEEEDKILEDHVKVHGKGQWSNIAKNAGLKRCGKSCRLRWMNYLSPSVKHGKFTEEEEDLIIRLHNLLGKRWSLIAKRVPGRTDNQVKNYWNTHVTKKLAVKERNGKVGIIKKSSSRFGVSSSENTKPAVQLSKTDSNLNLNLCGSSTTSNIEVPDDHQGTLQEAIEELASDQEPLMIKDSCLNSFWFSDLELGDFSMELLDGYSFNVD